ncbi:MAG: sulfotransferase domain-containing protein [Rhodothermales bacterium]
MEHGQQQPKKPVVFHITHWKAGSQWVRQVLSEAQPRRVVEVKNDMSHVTKDPIVEGGLYSPVYLTRDHFEAALDPALDKRMFVVIRDLRDTLISWYFSLKVSHRLSNQGIAKFREQLSELNLEDGLQFLICGKLAGIAAIQQSWIASNKPIFRYEELLADELTVFKKIFAHCEIDLSVSEGEEFIRRHSFERKSGRKRGEEDIQSHYRKAIVGDWENYFSKSIKDLFKEKFGHVLIDTGYESNFDW